MSSKTMGLRIREGMEEEQNRLESSSGSESAYEVDEGEGERVYAAGATLLSLLVRTSLWKG